jgi:hypothetical protein
MTLGAKARKLDATDEEITAAEAAVAEAVAAVVKEITAAEVGEAAAAEAVAMKIQAAEERVAAASGTATTPVQRPCRAPAEQRHGMAQSESAAAEIRSIDVIRARNGGRGESTPARTHTTTTFLLAVTGAAQVLRAGQCHRPKDATSS